MYKKRNIRKIDLIRNLSNKTGYPVFFSKKILSNLIDALISNIKNENNLNIKNFGSFNITHKKERTGRNPKTKKEYLIKSRKSLRFIPSKTLTKKLDKFYE